MSDQVKIDFKTTYDGKAAEQAAQGVKKVEDAAKKSTTGVAGLEEGFRKVSSKMELVNKVFSGLGLIGFIGGIIAAVSNLKKYFDEAAAAARKITLDKISKDNENAVKGIATAYEALLKSVEAVNTAILRQRELEAARTKNKRDMEDVQDAMDQQNELDKLDRKDPLYKEKSGEINAKYKSIAVMRASGREDEDLQTKMQLEGDKIRDLRNKEMGERSQAETVWSEYARQQKQIEELNKPVMNTRDIYTRSVGVGAGAKIGEEQFENKKATKQNRAKAEELQKELLKLEKMARDHVAKADEFGTQAIHAANMASTISTSRTVALAKAENETSKAASGRKDAYYATDVAKEANDKAMEEKRKKDEDEKYQQKAIPVIQQTQEQLDSAKQRASDAMLSEQQAIMERDSRKRSFEESGSRNTTQFKKTMEPIEAKVEQAKALREAADKSVKVFTDALEFYMSTYGEGFKQSAAKLNRMAAQQKMDAPGN